MLKASWHITSFYCYYLYINYSLVITVRVKYILQVTSQLKNYFVCFLEMLLHQVLSCIQLCSVHFRKT